MPVLHFPLFTFAAGRSANGMCAWDSFKPLVHWTLAGTPVQGWITLDKGNEWLYDQLWLVMPLNDDQGVGYTIWNLRSGTYLELSNGQ
jgi:hypothetical protein